jgi:hypothetical protein
MSSPNKYRPSVNMPERVVAAYWQGSLTRAEAQKIFDEYGATITAQGKALIQQDLAIAYLCEQFGITPEDVTKWAQEKATLAQVDGEEKSIIPASA